MGQLVPLYHSGTHAKHELNTKDRGNPVRTDLTTVGLYKLKLEHP
jgi:hypothetical protein